MDVVNVLKVFVPAAAAFFIGIAITPFVTHFLYKYKLWKKKARTEGLLGSETPLFHKLHKEKEVNTPRMGGVVIWASAGVTVFLFWALQYLFPGEASEKFNFLSRNQTWLPLFTLIAASLVGLFDDLLVVFGRGGYVAGGLPLSFRIATVLGIGAIGAWWFFVKLGVSSVSIPFFGEISLGFLFIPFFMFVMLALFSGGIIDGIDGLSGGILAVAFTSYAGIAFFQNQIDLAAFSAVIAGGILAFLWFNVQPARFYMSETGILGLTTTLAVVAFLTDAVLVLPLIAFFLFAAPASVIAQLISKKFFGRKLFLIAPIHHHFEAIGWPPYKVVMRFWILSGVLAILGMAIALL